MQLHFLWLDKGMFFALRLYNELFKHCLLFSIFHTPRLFNSITSSDIILLACTPWSLTKTDATFFGNLRHGFAATHFSLALLIISRALQVPGSGPLIATCMWAFNIFWLSLFLDLVLILLRVLPPLSGQVLVMGALCMTPASFVITGKISHRCGVLEELWRASITLVSVYHSHHLILSSATMTKFSFLVPSGQSVITFGTINSLWRRIDFLHFSFRNYLLYYFIFIII